jgi:hypothetical protein
MSAIKDFATIRTRELVYAFDLMHRYARAAQVCAILILTAGAAPGQNHIASALQVTGEHLVAADPAGRLMVEPTLTIDPADPKHWIVAVIVTSPDLHSSDCATLVTLDAGHTWKRYDLHVAECFDPWLGFVGKNEVWLGVLEKASSLRLFRSQDGGQNWLPLQAAASDVDHETFVSRQLQDANFREIYIVAEQDARRANKRHRRQFDNDHAVCQRRSIFPN